MGGAVDTWALPQAERCLRAPPPPTPEGDTPPALQQEGHGGPWHKDSSPPAPPQSWGAPTQDEQSEGEVASGQGQSQDIFGAKTVPSTKPRGGNSGRPHVVLPLPKGGWQVPQRSGEMHEMQPPFQAYNFPRVTRGSGQPIEKWLKFSEKKWVNHGKKGKRRLLSGSVPQGSGTSREMGPEGTQSS